MRADDERGGLLPLEPSDRAERGFGNPARFGSVPAPAGATPLPPDIEARLRRELQPGERLVWSGQPLTKRIALTTLPIVLFGIPFTAFAVFWMSMALGMGMGGMGGPRVPGFFGWIFPLFGVPFVLVGVGMLTAPIWMIWRSKRTCYAITDRRAIVQGAGFGGAIETRSFEPAALDNIRRIEYPAGDGDLVFEETITDREGQRGRTRIGFVGIAEVRTVEDLLRKTLLMIRPDER
jgi:hypothetical protein